MLADAAGHHALAEAAVGLDGGGDQGPPRPRRAPDRAIRLDRHGVADERNVHLVARDGGDPGRLGVELAHRRRRAADDRRTPRPRASGTRDQKAHDGNRGPQRRPRTTGSILASSTISTQGPGWIPSSVTVLDRPRPGGQDWPRGRRPEPGPRSRSERVRVSFLRRAGTPWPCRPATGQRLLEP